MGSPVRLGFLVLFLLTAVLYGQRDPRQGDYHTLEDEGRRLYSVSAFAHGHRHGYEEGYRVADQEIHFGMRQRELRERDVPETVDYSGHFGDKRLFRDGFVRGFIVGYRASYANGPFRVPEWLQEVPPFPWRDDLPQSAGPLMPARELRRSFDEGTRTGYESGMLAHVGETAAPSLAGRAEEVCKTTPQSRKEGFCDGFRQGFLMAVRDRASVLAERPAVAQKAAETH